MPKAKPWTQDKRIAGTFQACTEELSSRLNKFAAVVVAAQRDFRAGNIDRAEARLRGSIIASQAERRAKKCRK